MSNAVIKHILVRHGDNVDDQSVYRLSSSGGSHILARSELDPGTPIDLIGEVVARVRDDDDGILLSVGRKTLRLDFLEVEAVLTLLNALDRAEQEVDLKAQYFEIKKV